MNPSIKTLIFDLDGTLVDTLGGISNAINSGLKSHGLDPLSMNEIIGQVGRGGTALVEYALKKNGRVPDSELIDQVQNSYLHAYILAPLHETKLMPGVISMLERATACGLNLCVCTNKTRVLATAILNELGLAPYFNRSVFGDSLSYRKPHPAQIKLIIEQLCELPESCVMIGDTESDMQAAQASGVRSVFVNFGYGRKGGLLSKPDWYIDHFDQLEFVLSDIGFESSIT